MRFCFAKKDATLDAGLERLAGSSARAGDRLDQRRRSTLSGGALFPVAEPPSLPVTTTFGVPPSMIRLLASLALAFALATVAHAQERVVNVYNWSDYVDPKALDEFTKTTGIKVVYDTYDNNEIVETKLLAGKSGYDHRGALRPVPAAPDRREGLPEARQGEAAQPRQPMARGRPSVSRSSIRATNTPSTTCGAPPASASTSRRCASILGDMPLNTWDLVLKPEIASKLKACGIYMLDSPEDLFPGVLAYLGLNPEFQAQRGSDESRRRPVPRARQHPEVPLVGIHQRPRQRRYLRRGRLFGRHDPGPQPRRRGQERRRDRLCDSARGRAHVVRQLRDSGRRQERRRGARIHQLHDAAGDRRREHEFRLLRVGQSRGARNSSTRRSSRIRASIRTTPPSSVCSPTPPTTSVRSERSRGSGRG